MTASLLFAVVNGLSLVFGHIIEDAKVLLFIVVEALIQLV